MHTHTQPPTQPFITSKHDMKSLLVREQVDGSTVLSTKTKYIQGHSTKLLLPELPEIAVCDTTYHCACVIFTNFTPQFTRLLISTFSRFMSLHTTTKTTQILLTNTSTTISFITKLFMSIIITMKMRFHNRIPNIVLRNVTK